MQSQVLSMKKYVLWFSITYLVCSVVSGGILIYFDIDSSAPTFITVFVSAYVAVQRCIKDHGRGLTKSEIWSATWGSWASSLLLTLLFVICLFFYVFYDVLDQLTMANIEAELANHSMNLNVIIGITIFATIFVMILALGVTRIAYGVCNEVQSKKIPAIAKPQ